MSKPWEPRDGFHHDHLALLMAESPLVATNSMIENCTEMSVPPQGCQSTSFQPSESPQRMRRPLSGMDISVCGGGGGGAQKRSRYLVTKKSDLKPAVWGGPQPVQAHREVEKGDATTHMTGTEPCGCNIAMAIHCHHSQLQYCLAPCSYHNVTCHSHYCCHRRHCHLK